MVEFKDRLQAALDHAGIDAAALARHLRVSSASISKYKAGTSTSMSAPNCAKTAKHCGVSGYWLATGEGAMVPTDAENLRDEIDPESRELVTAFQAIDDPLVRSNFVRDVMAAAYRSQNKGDAKLKSKKHGARIDSDIAVDEHRSTRIDDGVAEESNETRHRGLK